MSRSLHLRNFRKLSQHLKLYLQRSNKLGLQAGRYKFGESVSYSSKFAVLLQTLRTVIMTDQTEPTSLNIDEELQQALENGDKAILNLMEQLKNFVLVISEEYRNCISKQMEIMERASNAGPFSEAWDELPEYRTLANELEKELNEYLTVFNTLGRMADKKTLIELVSGPTENLDSVATKYKELEALLKKEVDENKKIHTEFLRIKRDNILKEAST